MRIPCRRLRWRAAAWLLLALTPASTPAPASEPAPAATDAPSGLAVQVEGWWVTPRNAGLDIAFVDEDDEFLTGGDVVSLSFDSTLMPVLQAGWRPASAPGAELGARLWEYDDASEAHTGVHPLLVGPLLRPPAVLAFSKWDSGDAVSRLRATYVDGFASRTFEPGGGGTALRLAAGLRLFQMEQETTVVYVQDLGQVRVLTIDERMKVEGLGPGAGLSFVHRFGRRFGVGGSLGLAAPVGDLDATTQSRLTIDGAADDNFDIDVRQSERGAFLQVDGQLRIELGPWGGWSASVAYAFDHWSDVRLRQRFVDAAAQATTVPVYSDAVLEGLRAGLRYEF